MKHRILVTGAVASVLTLVACMDKDTPTQITASPTARLNLVTRMGSAAPTRIVDVTAYYRRIDSIARGVDTIRSRVVLAHKVVTAAIGTVQVPLTVDLSKCLADANREGGAGSTCPVRLSVVLQDSGSFVLDSKEIGPLNAGPGSAPAVPALDLDLNRSAVLRWDGDDALRLGGRSTPLNGLVAGTVSGTAAPVLYGSATGADSLPRLGIFENGTWRHVAVTKGDVPPNSFIQDIAALSPAEVYFIVRSALFRFDGTKPTKIATIQDTTLTSLAVVNTGGTSRKFVIGSLAGNAWVGDGTTFQRFTLNAAQNISDICITSATEAFATGNDRTAISPGSGQVYRYNGATWALTPTNFSHAKVQLQCPSPGRAYVISAQEAALQWNGTSWGFPSFTLPVGRLWNWGIVSPTEVYAYADSVSLNRKWLALNGGTTFREVGTTLFTQGQGAEMWADPRGGAAYVMTSGRLEQVTPTGVKVLSQDPPLRDIVVTSASSAFAVGWNLFLARWNGTRWTVDAPPANTQNVRILEAVWSDGPNNAWTVGNAGTILRWNGSAWSVVSDNVRTLAPFDPTQDRFYGVWGTGSTVFIAGSGGMARCTSAATVTCSREAGTNSTVLNGVWGTSATDIFAVGDAGRIFHYNGTSWQSMASPTTRNLARVWGSSPTDVWAIGDSTLIHLQGGQWGEVSMSGELAPLRGPVRSDATRFNGGALQGIFQFGLWGTAANDVYLGGNNGAIAHFDGTAWHVMPTPTDRRILGMSGVRGVGAMAVTETQEVFRDGPTLLRGIGSSGTFSSPFQMNPNWP